jgi:glucose/arabinose dehydrogenase
MQHSSRHPLARLVALILPIVLFSAALGQSGPASELITSFEIPQLRVVTVAEGLSNPFAMAFRSNGDILITERYTGRLRLVRNGQLLASAIPGVPAVYGEIFRAGLMAVALHPDDDELVYLTFTKSIEVDGETEQTVALVRGRLREDRLTDVKELFTAKGLDRGIAGAALLFAPDKTLFMSVGGAYVYAGLGDYAQDPAIHYGKLLRLNDDGSVPADNPFVTSGAYLPEVYSVGHRNQLGLAFHPVTGKLWASENGPQGGDEVNIIEPGANYGWPLVSYSRQYRGEWITENRQQEGLVNPVVIWWPSIAPAGITFYTGDKFPEWQGNLFVGSMVTGRIPGTGHLERIVFNSNGDEIRRESLLRERGERVRDVQQGPDGFLYVLTDEESGSLLRLEPAAVAN